MSKYSGKVRDELLSMKRKERQELRCDLIKELSVAKNKLVKAEDSLIKKLNKQIEETQEERCKILKEHKLLSFSVSYGECRTSILHTKIIEFDKQTDKEIKEILIS